MAADRRPPAWSPLALADLAEAWRRYATIAGRLTADKTVRDVGAACGTLQQRPYAGRARDEVRPGLRAIAAGPLVVFYRVTRAEDVQVLRVLDRRNDAAEMFGGEGERR